LKFKKRNKLAIGNIENICNRVVVRVGFGRLEDVNY